MTDSAPKLFLDCDRVLADFDAGAREVLGGMSPAQFEERFSKREFWRRLAATPDFYNTLPLMPDAQALFDAVAHLRPTILTGLPIFVFLSLIFTGGDFLDPMINSLVGRVALVFSAIMITGRPVSCA